VVAKKEKPLKLHAKIRKQGRGSPHKDIAVKSHGKKGLTRTYTAADLEKKIYALEKENQRLKKENDELRRVKA
jgi:hypothetical protein